MALSDVLKKYGDSTATEGIMFPSAGVQSVTTEQQVYDSTTDGIMTVTGQQYSLPTYKGPTATVQYGGEEAGYPRMLRQIEQGELPQFKQEDFPKQGEGITQTPPSSEITLPFEPTPDPTPVDPCPSGYKLVNGVCQPIQQDRGGRPPEEPMFGPGKTPFQNIEFANNILSEGNQNYDYYKNNKIVDVNFIGGGVRTSEAEADLQNYFSTIGTSPGTDISDISKLDDSTFFSYLESSGLDKKYKSTIAEFNLSNIVNKPEAGTSLFPGVDALMALAEKDMIKGAINTYNNAGLTTTIKVDGRMYQTGTAEYNAALKNALDNNLNFTLGFDTPKLNAFNANFGKLNTDIQNNRNLMSNLSKLNKDMVETTIVKLAASGQGVDRIKNMNKPQLIAFASPREDIHAKSFGFNKYSPKTKKQIVESKHDDSNISKTSTDTINRMSNDERTGYRVDVKELSKREHNNKNSYGSKNKETADETIARIAKNVEEDPMAKRTGSSAFANKDTKKSIKSGNDSKNEKKIVCTMMNDSYGFGSFRNKIWLAQSKNLSKEYEIGYHTLFLPLVKYAKQKGFTNNIVKKILEHIAIHRTVDIRKQKYNRIDILGRMYRTILEPLCYITGGIKTWKKK